MIRLLGMARLPEDADVDIVGHMDNWAIVGQPQGRALAYASRWRVSAATPDASVGLLDVDISCDPRDTKKLRPMSVSVYNLTGADLVPIDAWQYTTDEFLWIVGSVVAAAVVGAGIVLGAVLGIVWTTMKGQKEPADQLERLVRPDEEQQQQVGFRCVSLHVVAEKLLSIFITARTTIRCDNDNQR